MITTTLSHLGFNEKEVKVYLALLKYGKMRPSVLASRLSISRPTLYVVAKSLLAKGVIAEDLTEKVLHFIPLPVESLKTLLDTQKRELGEKEAQVVKAISELSMITADKKYTIPKIRFVSEEAIEKYLFANTVRWQESVISSDGIWWGFQDKNFATRFEKWIHSTWETKQSKHTNYLPQFLTNESAVESKISRKHGKGKRQIKFISHTDFTANMWVCGDSVVMIVAQTAPAYLIEIQDQMIAHNLKEVFKRLWEEI